MAFDVAPETLCDPRASPPPNLACWQAIVLAAGASARFGGGKLLAPYRGGRLIDSALRSASQAPVERVTVVTGHDRAAVSAHVAAFFHDLKSAPALNIVHASDYADGLAASLKAGVEAIPKAASGVFVFLGDMPDIPQDAPRRLGLFIGDHAAASPVYRGVRGHPVLFKRSLFPSLLALSGDQGARSLLDNLGLNLLLMDCDSPGVLFDVDRQQDLAL